MKNNFKTVLISRTDACIAYIVHVRYKSRFYAINQSHTQNTPYEISSDVQ